MSKKGTREERELVKMLWDADCAAMRAPASGGATKKPLPDVIAGNGKIYLAIEVKSTSQERIYIDSGKIDALLEFSEIFGAQPYVGAKFIREKWRFVRIEHLHKTKQYYQSKEVLRVIFLFRIAQVLQKPKADK